MEELWAPSAERVEAATITRFARWVQETRQVMQIALEKHSARSSEVGSLVAETEQSISALRAALAGLQQADAGHAGAE